MKIMLDTNVLISAFVFGGQTGELLERLWEMNEQLYVSEYIDQEFKAKLEAKWPLKAEKIYQLYHRLNIVFCESTSEILGELRDKKDIPVLSDAIYHKMDMILTGDKDFLESDIEQPLIFSPGMMIEYLNSRSLDRINA